MKINKDRLVLSVESELCAGGDAVAEAVAKKLGLRCRTREILPAASILSGISLKLLRRYEEKQVRHAYDLTAESVEDLRIPPAREFLAAQIAACRSLAEQGPCVLAEHHANAALSDREDHVRIFVHAPREDRLREFARRWGLLPEKAARAFAREDRARSRYFRNVAPRWGKSGNYDLSVNAAAASPEVLADHVVRYLESVSRETLVHPTPAQKRSA